jgi:hypothetical protein
MIRGKETYDVFVRDWWRRPEKGDGPGWPGGRVPYPGAPKHYIARGVSHEEAREICAEYNASHEPGWESRKAEFEEAS